MKLRRPVLLRTAAMRHEPQLPPSEPSARYRFAQETFAGTNGNMATGEKRRFRMLVERRADQVSSGLAFFSRFPMLRRRIGAGRHCCRPRGPGRQVPQTASSITSMFQTRGVVSRMGNLVGNFDLWRGSTLPPSARTGHCLCGRILPATMTVGQALSSQNVSNRTTS
jgi:hypothetical protein